MPAHTPYQKYAHEATNPAEALKRLIELHDIAIQANQRKDAKTVLHSLSLLRATLVPEKDLILASRLLSLYQTIEYALESERFEVSGEILESLKGLWIAQDRCTALKS